MREILFKAKSIATGEWVYGNYAFTDTNGEQHFIFHNKAFEHEVDKDTICQFTGLLDKNGNKIWENDIVKIPMFKHCNMAIGFIEGAFCLVNAESKYVADIHYIHHAGINNTEVIGNVFDNKELLEE